MLSHDQLTGKRPSRDELVDWLLNERCFHMAHAIIAGKAMSVRHPSLKAFSCFRFEELSEFKQVPEKRRFQNYTFP